MEPKIKLEQFNLHLTWDAELNAYMQGYGSIEEAQGFFLNEDGTWSRCLDSHCGFQISNGGKYETILECFKNDFFGS